MTEKWFIKSTHMPNAISKTDYLLYRECAKNAWMKRHRAEVYYASELSEFEKHIIETGNEVELVARELFPTGVLVEGRDEAAQKETAALIAAKQETIFQPIFVKDGFLAAVDILKYDAATGRYALYEVKASNEIDPKVHLYDLAFQVVLLRKCGLSVGGMYLVHLNKEYVRAGELDIVQLFSVDDVGEDIENMLAEVERDMLAARDYLLSNTEPKGTCGCLYKGRSNHCATFAHHNPHVPAYSVHDLHRIGSSKRKLMELVDVGVFHLHEIGDRVELNEAQQKQVQVYAEDRVLLRKDKIAEELAALQYPLYFLDYETFPSAIPLFDGYSPYDQVPFQYSLHILEAPDAVLKSVGFLYTESGDPAPALARSLAAHIGPVGSMIVWYKPFEKTRNSEMAARMPDTREFFESVNARIFDLMEIFSKQHYVHKDFKGSASIKKVLPVMVPELSYKDLDIREGGAAAQSWKKIIDRKCTVAETEKIAEDLKKYCERDTYAMYAIWRELGRLL